MRRLQSRFYLFATLVVLSTCLCSTTVLAQQAAPAELAKSILKSTGLQGGFIVHLNCGDGALTAALKANDSIQVHGISTNAAAIFSARQVIKKTGKLGEVSVDLYDGKNLPYIDNMVNLIVAEDAGDVPTAELMRVLVPNGIAYIKSDGKWITTVKPRPGDIDDWTHFLHDPSGNAVAHDDVVGPPRHLQWVGSPRWSRHHDRMASMSALVSANGRMFYVMDEGSRVSIQLPPDWKLIARDAFNGSILWKRDIPNWQSHLWPLKSGPTQLARRLVATKSTVFVPLGFEAPLTAIDAITGEVKQTYAGTSATEEVIFSQGVLFLVVNRNKSQLTDFAPKFNVGDQGRVAKEFHWNKQPREVLAVDAKSGDILWKVQSKVAPLTLTTLQNRVFFHNGEKVVCLNRESGTELWQTAPAGRRENVTMNFGPKLVIYQNVALFAGGDRKMTAFSVKDGKQLWSAKHEQSGYQSPEDLLVVGGLVWSAPTTKTQDSGIMTGRDPYTGEVKIEFPPDVSTYWFHHRCYIAKATDKYLIPSRTGIEFVDYKKQSWEIHHWVRGGCLYGVMPCNGLLYAPPHNCACYPEAKLYGFNALAPASKTFNIPRDIPDAERLEKGPAYGTKLASADATHSVNEWPTFRQNPLRSGSTKATVADNLQQSWQTELGGRLSAVVVSAGKLFVSQIDKHTVTALDAKTGEVLWNYTTGARVDSPPTVHRGYVLFGSTDGWAYCVNSENGELIWRFRAAPIDRRLMSFEQLESVWPVHGNILIQNDVAYFVAGRSNFLDGGLRFLRLDVETGEKLSETYIDEINPETKKNIQDKVMTLNMPVGLPDILSCDGENVYMRSQKFDLYGNRLEIGPHSGVPAEQGATQTGAGTHLFAPMGYLDGTWFHRAYWVYGRSFAGGHSGYHQAGKFTPSGRIIVHDNDTVYGFGRKAQYYRWTTTMEHQLFASSTDRPTITPKAARRGAGNGMVDFGKATSLNPAKKELTVEAWVKPNKPSGVIMAHGGPAIGYALTIAKGKPTFVARVDSKIYHVQGPKRIVGKWTHLAAKFSSQQISLFVNGKKVAEGAVPGLIDKEPAQGFQIGADDASNVGDYNSPNTFSGIIDEVRVYKGLLTEDEIAAQAAEAGRIAEGAELLLACSFNDGKPTDASEKKNSGKANGVKVVAGKVGKGLQFISKGGGGGSKGNTFHVKHNWAVDVPLLVTAMLKAGDKIVVAGPPDLINEEDSFLKLINREDEVQQKLADQDAALSGSQGAILRIVSAADGSKISEYKLPSLPVWDGLATAYGRLYLATQDGKVLCYGEK